MKIRDIALAVLCSLIAVAAFAQGEGHEGHGMSEEQMMMMQKWQQAATPGPQHAMMAESAGTYKLTVKSWYEPGGEPEVSEATAEREMMMGGRYMKETVEGSMGGDQTFSGMGLAGYDNVTGKHWSTWMDNMSTGLSKMTGDYDPETKTLTMTGESSDPMTGSMKQVKSVTHFMDGKEVTEFYETQGDQMVKTMEITYVKM